MRFFHGFKGTVRVACIVMNLSIKEGVNVEDITFLNLQVFNSDNVTIVSVKQEMRHQLQNCTHK